MRCSLFISNTSLIPFSQEMEHVKAYLAIEKVRFEDDLNIIYDIQFEHFKIPPLTIQPMVEYMSQYSLGEATLARLLYK